MLCICGGGRRRERSNDWLGPSGTRRAVAWPFDAAGDGARGQVGISGGCIAG